MWYATLSLSAAVFLLPAVAIADTRLIQHEGRLDPAKHDKIQNALKATLPAARMTYGIRITCDRFPGADWAIAAPLIVTNPTKQKLYCEFYIAFFDVKGRLVGCTSQGTAIDPGAREHQFGSCIIHGVKSKLLSATHYQAVVYESDRPIGAEPISAKDAAGLPGTQQSVITKLRETGSDVKAKDDFTELRLGADCSFHEPEKGSRNTHLRIKNQAEYDIYLSMAESEQLVTRPGKEPLKLPPSWRMSAEIERLQSPKNLASWYHVALLDAKGKLVVCTSRRPFWMDAPKDRLLAARKLLVVVYETPLARGK